MRQRAYGGLRCVVVVVRYLLTLVVLVMLVAVVPASGCGKNAVTSGCTLFH
jgi:hypothetical protein